MKTIRHQFVIEIPGAPNDAVAWQQVKAIAREGRLAEFVVAVQTVTEAPVPVDWKAALKPKRKQNEK